VLVDRLSVLTDSLRLGKTLFELALRRRDARIQRQIRRGNLSGALAQLFDLAHGDDEVAQAGREARRIR
jgi:ABC-type uncharacterized transport system permease subunit